ncbi:MAG: hypothetical protein IIX28_02710 [Clostridia bacterium]|nr:hypothetical protein [Clostridia bacterium]
MLYVTIEDFYARAGEATRLTREQERACAAAMAAGDADARRRLIQSYLPHVASAIRRAPADIRTLHTVYAAIAALEKAVDTFRFQQEGETFAHHLSWRLRQCLTRRIAER